MEDISQHYLSASQRATQGERTLSIDQMTGIQALERAMPSLPLRPGKVECREFEYIRHGTQTGKSQRMMWSQVKSELRPLTISAPKQIFRHIASS